MDTQVKLQTLKYREGLRLQNCPNCDSLMGICREAVMHIAKTADLKTPVVNNSNKKPLPKMAGFFIIS